MEEMEKSNKEDGILPEVKKLLTKTNILSIMEQKVWGG